MKLNLKETNIHMGTFDYSVNVIIGSYEDAVKYAHFKLEHLFEDDGYSPRGRTFYKKGYAPIVWIPKYPKIPREIATLCHEMFHATCHIMDWASIPLTYASEEVYAHAQSWLVTESLRRLKK